MNWGVKIFITLLLFVIIAVSTGIYMVSNDHDSLIEEDYYEKGLEYDSTYNHKTNVKELNLEPQLVVDSGYMVIQFQETGSNGLLALRRESDSSQDLELPFSTKSNVFRLPIADLSDGRWNIRIDWKSHKGVPLLFEKSIYIR
ncbi:FixH family protein [Albibacterium profundi]|uniref:FixH family protein n=1 Tax=Albibacterium profundi TaxID=3134906 RepID=A0ABV5CAQ8_9SPHI